MEQIHLALGYSADGFITWQLPPMAERMELTQRQLFCSQEQFENFRDYQVVGGVLVKRDPLADAKRIQTNSIQDHASAQLETLTSQYPAGEVSTWDQQYAEAMLHATDPEAPTPILGAISAVSGRAVTQIAETVIAKASAYKAFSGSIIGKRMALFAQIDAATTVEAVKAIVW